MPIDQSFANGSSPTCNVAEINRKLDAGEWAMVKESIGLGPKRQKEYCTKANG